MKVGLINICIAVPELFVPSGLFGKNLLFGIGSGNVHDGHSASGGMVGCNLARCYGKLRQHLHAMDSQMKVCIGMTIAELNQTRLTNWDDVITCMLENEALEPMESRTIHRSDTFKKESVDYFKFDGSPDVTKTRYNIVMLPYSHYYYNITVANLYM